MTSNTTVENFRHEFRRLKDQADKAIASLDDPAFTQRLSEQVNPVALIVKHVAGNLVSRWTDFLTTDGDKPTRDRDSEFILNDEDTRANLLAFWERGWKTLFDTLTSLNESDLERIVTIRGEPHTAFQALLRSATHTSYHVGQILYLARVFRPSSPWLTIAPGESKNFATPYTKNP